MPQHTINEIKYLFNLQVVSLHERYLGLPSMVGRNKMTFFNLIKHRVIGKLNSWQSKLFSSGGKEVLIKAVIQAISTYAMSVFRVPQKLCNKIQRLIKRFW